MNNLKEEVNSERALSMEERRKVEKNVRNEQTRAYNYYIVHTHVHVLVCVHVHVLVCVHVHVLQYMYIYFLVS